MKKLIFAGLTLMVFASCGESAPTKKETKEETKIPETDTRDTLSVKKDSVIKENFYNDLAKILAGREVGTSSEHYSLSQSAAFKNYSSTVERNFTRFENDKLGSLKKWSNSDLKDINDETKEVLYPFSGPDIVYAYSMLPKAENYYLFGLEPVGEIPNLEDYPVDSLPKLFSTLSSSISDNLNLSFFITKNMKVDLRNPIIQGTIPVLLFFMSRMDLHVQDIQPVDIDLKGKIVKNPKYASLSTKKSFKSGVEITFVRPNDNSVGKVYYFSKNIANDGFSDKNGLSAFMNSLGNVTTMVKSASYCMHEDKFSMIRNLLLENSKAIVQDDTGIPYNIFDKEAWKISLYGKYTVPVRVFSEYLQQDLKDEMQKSAKNISFRYGYNSPSNILVARKK